MILLDRLTGQAVIVGDGEYDTIPLHDLAAAKDLALLAPAPKKARSTGHRYISPHRKAGMALSQSTAGSEFLMARVGIERSFAPMTACSCGLAVLPSWIRRPHRVVVWVAAKMLIDLDRRIRLTQQIRTPHNLVSEAAHPFAGEEGSSRRRPKTPPIDRLFSAAESITHPVRPKKS